MENPLYIKPLLLNIRLGIIRIEIEKLEEEVAQLEICLYNYDWDEVKVENKLILKEMINHHFELDSLIEKIDLKKTFH
ncbi:hypothetical protein ACFJYU_12280 [Enterococcus faecalis]